MYKDEKVKMKEYGLLNECITTPIQFLTYYSNITGCNIYCKREDLYPAYYGGSKARIVKSIMNNVKEDYIVSAGHPNSNFNRVLSLYCAEKHKNLTLVIYDANKDNLEKSINFKIVKASGAKVIYSEKSDVEKKINDICNDFQQKKLSYKYIYGGGRCLEGCLAYYNYYNEIQKQCSIVFDYIFLACGTGTTTAGIISGLQENNQNTQVYSLSIARTKEREYPIIEEDIELINKALCKKFNTEKLILIDDYIGQEYGIISKEVSCTIKECLKYEGIILDPTYSGKSFYGMIKTLNNKQFIGKNILFIQTGGGCGVI